MLYKLIPYPLFGWLWGNRRAYGLKPKANDSEWILWLKKAYSDFYPNTQQKGVGNWVCRLAYSIISKIDFKGKTILEIGPGEIRHLQFMNSKPKQYVLCDVTENHLAINRKLLDEHEIPNKSVLIDPSKPFELNFPDKTFDVVLSFNVLEHLQPLDHYLTELSRTLKCGGYMAGGIPCEGGLAWGIGRFITTRRYVRNHYGINYDKIICWEHPNFADQIVRSLSDHFQKVHLHLRPFPFLPVDLNLVASFLYRNICNCKEK